jgi:hypothetical protein
MFIDEESNFMIYIGPDFIGDILDVIYNDIDEIAYIWIKTDNREDEQVLFETNILSWYDCNRAWWKEGNDKLWWINEEYIFMVNEDNMPLDRHAISFLPYIENWNSQESLRTNLPCSVTPLE